MSTDPESRTGFGPYLDRVGPSYTTTSDADGDNEDEVNVIRYGVIEDLEKAFDMYGHETAAFLVEPIQGEAGYVILYLLVYRIVA